MEQYNSRMEQDNSRAEPDNSETDQNNSRMEQENKLSRVNKSSKKSLFPAEADRKSNEFAERDEQPNPAESSYSKPSRIEGISGTNSSRKRRRSKGLKIVSDSDSDETWNGSDSETPDDQDEYASDDSFVVKGEDAECDM